MAEENRSWTRQSEAFWRAHHEAWKRSDLNQRQYCEAQGIPSPCFAPACDQAACSLQGGEIGEDVVELDYVAGALAAREVGNGVIAEACLEDKDTVGVPAILPAAPKHFVCADGNRNVFSSLLELIVSGHRTEPLQCRMQQRLVRVGSVHCVGRIKELRRAAHEMKLTALQVWPHGSRTEVTRPARFKDVIKRERAKAYEEAGIRRLGKAHIVAEREVRPPIHIDII